MIGIRDRARDESRCGEHRRAATDVILAACMTYQVGDRDEAKRLMSIIDTEDRANRVFREMIRTPFGLPTFDWE